MRARCGALALMGIAMISIGVGGCAPIERRAPVNAATRDAATPPLFAGLGDLHHAITTTSPEAQRYFDQGLRLVYAFNHEEAERSFEQAAKLDPRAAMAHWGLALALGPNINRPLDPEREKRAYEAIQAALALSSGVSERERAYIEALATRYAEHPTADRAARDRAYADAMRRLSKRFPDDVDAATLFAESLMDLRPWGLWTRDGKPSPETPEIVATLESVLARAPDHPGANHYYIHAVEASPHPERALPSAERLPALMPDAGHIVHMPSHIYLRLGRYADAANANERASMVDRAYFDRESRSPYYRMLYYPHNLVFLAFASGMEGRHAKAMEAAWAAATSISDAEVREVPMLEGLRAAPFFALIRFGQWTSILEAPAPPAEQRFTSGIARYARGLAFARISHHEKARAELGKLEAIIAALPEHQMLMFNHAAPVLKLAAAVLSGEIAATEGRFDDAIADLRRAVAIEDGLGYGEPPDWPESARHHLGAVLLAAGRPSEAEAVYREDLRARPENGWALLGLEQSLRATGRLDEAAAVHARFASAFARADIEPTGSRL